MGCIFRTSKCCSVKQIKNAKSEEERLQLKPDCVKSAEEWKRFVKSKTSADFKIQSEKFKAIRNMQMLHTCSHRGMTRLTEDLKAQSDNPSSVSRAQVWIKSHTRKNGEPEKIKKNENDSQSTSSGYNVKEDALVQVLGQDRPGRLRAMGRGVTMTKVVLSHAKEKQATQFQNRISELERIVHKFMNNQLCSCRRNRILNRSRKFGPFRSIGKRCSKSFGRDCKSQKRISMENFICVQLHGRCYWFNSS